MAWLSNRELSIVAGFSNYYHCMSQEKIVRTISVSDGISGSRRNCSSLCTEELAGNIVRHGFTDNKKHSIDIRVSYINDDIVICFKDDGIPFNPEEASRLLETQDAMAPKDEDAFKNIGLQLVNRLSRSMTYQNTFGLNILTIVI